MEEKIFNEQEFLSPPGKYRSMPFWAWNGELKDAELCTQIDELKKMGFGGFYMHARLGLTEEYMGEGFLGHIKTAVEKAEKEGMYACVYDEDRCPSGYAGGAVTKNPKFAARFMTMKDAAMEEAKPESEAIRTGAPYLLGIYDIQLDAENRLLSYRCITHGEKAEYKRVYIYTLCNSKISWMNNERSVDPLCPEAVDTFIALTHEKYKKTVGDWFGGIIPTVFTDETTIPHCGWFDVGPECPYNLHWSPVLPQAYKKAYGEDILPELPALFYRGTDARSEQIRYRFYDLLAELFARNFSGKLGAWCVENNLRLTGHFHNEYPLSSQCGSSMDLMRQYRGMGIPGVDILFDAREYTSVKQAASVTHQYGKEGVLSELYGGSWWGRDFLSYRKNGDWQAALGVTHRVPHLTMYTMQDEGKRDYPASIGYQSPWHTAFSAVEDHFARLNTALMSGKPYVRIAVIHPVETMWQYFGPDDEATRGRKRTDENFENIADWLLFGQLDFDYLSESLMPEIWNGKAFGKMKYDTILVAGCETVRESTAEILRAFTAAGGRVIVAGDMPRYAGGNTKKADFSVSCHIPLTKDAVLSACESVRMIDIRHKKKHYIPEGMQTENYLTTLRKCEDGWWMFIANGRDTEKSLQTEKITVRFRGDFVPTLYDTVSGEKYSLPYAVHGEWTVFEKEVYPTDSLLIHWTKQPEIAACPAEKAVKETFSFPPKVSYATEEPNVLVLDKAEWRIEDGAWNEETEMLRITDAVRAHFGWEDVISDRDVQPYARKDTWVPHEITLRFSIESETEITGACLALEHIEKSEIWVDGKKMENADCGYYMDRKIRKVQLPTLGKGKTVIEVHHIMDKHDLLEWMYLLGNFGVTVCGTCRTLVPMAKKIGFASLTNQGFAHYGGNIRYKAEFAVQEEGDATLSCTHFEGAAVRVYVDGKESGIIAYPPYRVPIGKVAAGKHTIEAELLGTRENTCGPMHRAEEKVICDPMAWRTKEAAWCEEYRLRPFGILSAPKVEIR
ncbi:MAG: hypothetical protein IJN25_04785 [Clostridia bacterium]|nr:hypothetical protein [Clostridia bacterium]